MKSDPASAKHSRLWIRPRGRSRGQSLIEFGLIALTLVFLIGAGIDLGLMVTVRQTVSVITGEAARQVAYGAPVQDVFDAVDRTATGTLANISGLMVVLEYCPVGGGTCHPYCNARLYKLTTDPIKPNFCYEAPKRTQSPRLEKVSDLAKLSVWEEKYEILTPWIRGWASLPATQDDLCQQSAKPCYMRLFSSETVIYPGPAAP